MILLNICPASQHSPTTSDFTPHQQPNLLLYQSLLQYLAPKPLITLPPSCPSKRPREPNDPAGDERCSKRQKTSRPQPKPSEPSRVGDLRDINWYGTGSRKPMNVTPAVDSDSSCASTVSIGGTDDGFQDTEDDDLEEEDSDCDELLDTSDASPSDPDDSGPQIDIDSASIAYWLLTHAAHHLRGHLVYPLNERTNRLETLFRFDTDTDADEPVACEDHPVWSTRLFYDAVGVRDVEFTGGIRMVSGVFFCMRGVLGGG